LHVAAQDVDEISPADARSLANALLAAAQDAERLDAAALPALDQFLAAVDAHVSPAARLGISDEALGLA
jgi:hypothetical protein